MNIKYIRLALRGFTHHWFRKIDRSFNANFCKPVIVLLYLTNACNSNCKYCSLPHQKEPDELSAEEWKAIILDLKKWLGTFYLNLCGGEPFLRDDIFEIIKFANDIGIITDVTTNGLLLDEIKISKIIASRLSKIIFSLEGINRETHDALRGKGQFDKIISAIDLCKKEKINITLNTVINRYNLEELSGLVKFVYDNKLNGIKFVEVRVEFIKDKTLGEDLWPNKDKIDFIIDELIKLKYDGYPIINSLQNLELIRKYFLGLDPHFKNIYCNLPYDQLCIAANGDVLPCFLANNLYALRLGNLKINNSKHIWESKVCIDSRNQRRYCNRNCMMGEGYLTNEGIVSNIQRFYTVFIKQIKPCLKNIL